MFMENTGNHKGHPYGLFEMMFVECRVQFIAPNSLIDIKMVQ